MNKVKKMTNLKVQLKMNQTLTPRRRKSILKMRQRREGEGGRIRRLSQDLTASQE